MNGENETKLPLLFLCHRIPYPPNKGDKIRSFHLLKYLAKEFDVYLGTFIDDKQDWKYEAELDQYCRQRLVLALSPQSSTIKSLKGFVTNQALSIPYYESAEMTGWVKRVVNEGNIAHAIVYSSAMAQFIPADEFAFERSIIDFVDVDSDKWQQYAQQKSWPFSAIYRREASKLLALEKSLCERYDSSLFVSKAEADMFRTLCPSNAEKIGYYNNGVDSIYFDPERRYPNPYKADSNVIVFTGAMDYWPNVDAVVWFAHHVFPRLRTKYSKLQFYIVGGSPAAAVLRLGQEPGIVVTGRVEDVRPYIHHALGAIAPMRVARGVQNKVLEAMAMEKPVMVSRLGLEGISAINEEHLLIADTPEQYEHYFDRVVEGQFEVMQRAARRFITEHFDWDASLPTVGKLLSSANSGLANSCQEVAHSAS